MAIQWPPLRSEGFRYRPVLDFRDEGLRRVLLLMGPGTIGMAATQINVFVNTVLATGEGTGAVSCLDFAFRLMYLPIGLFGVSIATAATPAISRMVAERRLCPHSLDAGRRARVDAVPERAGDVGLMVLARADRRGDLRARQFTPADTDGDRRRAAVLRDRPGRLLGRPHCLADVLRAAAQPDPGDGVSAGSVVVNVALNVALVRVHGLSRPGARHVDHRARQRRGAVVAVAP